MGGGGGGRVYLGRGGGGEGGGGGGEGGGGGGVFMDDPLEQYREVETGQAFTIQNPRLLKVELSETT